MKGSELELQGHTVPDKVLGALTPHAHSIAYKGIGKVVAP